MNGRLSKIRSVHTPWFISNGTVQNVYLSADAEFLGRFFCMAGKLRNHRKYSETNFYNTMIFHYQYLNLFRQSPTAKYTHLKFRLDHNIRWYFSNITKYFCTEIFFTLCKFNLCLVFEAVFNHKGFPMSQT